MIAKCKVASAALCLSLALCSISSVVADSSDGSMLVNAKQMQWGVAPPTLPKGAKLAVLHGDPGKAEPFTLRLSLPANYRIGPHWHSQAEQLTVLSGAFYIGMGDKEDKSAAHALLPGGYHYLPSKAHHYASTRAPTIIQIHGVGPLDIVYLNPVDDPQNQK